MFGSLVKKSYSTITHYARKGSIGGAVLHKAEVYGAGRLLGYVHGKYREKAEVMGLPLVGVVGGVAAAGSMLGMLMSRGREPWWCSHLDAVADAGIAGLGFAQGVSDGTKAAGRSIFMIDRGQPVPAGLKATDVIGSLPQALGGDYLTAADLQRIKRTVK